MRRAIFALLLLILAVVINHTLIWLAAVCACVTIILVDVSQAYEGLKARRHVLYGQDQTVTRR